MDTLIGQTPAPGAPGADPVSDGDQKTFMQDVIEASRQTPVLVDFWATWCGPCKQLTPVLEKAVRAAQGRVKLVKIDIDKNRALVQQLAQLGLPLQSVPTVAAFWQGQIADLFQGALPESEIRQFIDNVLRLGGGALPVTEHLAHAKTLAGEGHHAEAAEAFSAVLGEDPESAEAWGGLVRALLALGDVEQAHEALARVPEKLAEHAEVAGARSALVLAEEGQKAASELAGLEARVAADASDHAARIALAVALNAMDRREEAAETLLESIRRDRAWNDGAARARLVELFEAWGFDDPATLAARRKLSALLFA